jgi:hypothetical protein
MRRRDERDEAERLRVGMVIALSESHDNRGK